MVPVIQTQEALPGQPSLQGLSRKDRNGVRKGCGSPRPGPPPCSSARLQPSQRLAKMHIPRRLPTLLPLHQKGLPSSLSLDHHLHS